MIKELFVSPGDKLAIIEEFEGKEGTYEDDGVIRSYILGKAIYDFKERIVRVNPIVDSKLPKPGDTVLGVIRMVSTNIVEMKILYVNDVKKVNLSGIAFSRTKKDILFKIGDLVRGKVINIFNSFIHVTFKDKRLGVVYTTCHVCGGKVIKIDTNTLKCVECNTKDERKLADDFGNIKSILPLSSVR